MIKSAGGDCHRQHRHGTPGSVSNTRRKRMTAQNRLINRERLAQAAALALALAPNLVGRAAAQGYGGYGPYPTPAPSPAPAPAPAPAAQGYRQVNLVSDQPGVAVRTDPNLINPWGISFGPSTPFWV